MQIKKGYETFMKGSDRLNADQLSDSLVKAGDKVAGKAGATVAAGLGVAAAAGGISAIMSGDTANPIHTVFTELPKELAEVSNTGGKIFTVVSNALETGAEVALLGLIANFGVQSVDAWVDYAKKTRAG